MPAWVSVINLSFSYVLPTSQVLLALMVWLETAGPAREDLREQLVSRVTLVRQGPRVFPGTAKRQCVWRHQRTPHRDYKRRGQSKDPIFRDPPLSLSKSTVGGRERKRTERDSPHLDNIRKWELGGNDRVATGCLAPPPYPSSLLDITTGSFLTGGISWS